MRDFKLVSKEKVSDETFKLEFQPTDGKPVAKHIPGQYTTLWFHPPEWEHRQPRHYSICSVRTSCHRVVGGMWQAILTLLSLMPWRPFASSVVACLVRLIVTSMLVPTGAIVGILHNPGEAGEEGTRLTIHSRQCASWRCRSSLASPWRLQHGKCS